MDLPWVKALAGLALLYGGVFIALVVIIGVASGEWVRRILKKRGEL